MDNKEFAKEIFLAGVESVRPEKLIPGFVRTDGKGFSIGEDTFFEGTYRNLFVTGAGKASAAMGEALEDIIGDMITGGHIVVKYGHSRSLKKIRVTEAGHPIPDHNGFEATRDILRISEDAGEDDLIICLLSGGGSSLLADHPPGSSEREMAILNDLLVKSGADINEINTVRKHLSLVKGGQLAASAYPAKVFTLTLSDVPGDLPEIIASGPLSPDPSTFSEALGIIEKLGLTGRLPETLYNYLKEGAMGLHPENPKRGDKVFEKVKNIIIGSNIKALQAAEQKASALGFRVINYGTSLFRDVPSAALHLADTIVKYRKELTHPEPLCILFGGETTLKVEANGLGGRNQHLALLSAKMARDMTGVTILCGGTDGTDGPTEAAGAVVDNNSWSEALAMKIDPEEFLRNFDSFHFFRKTGGVVITGPTMTNVMDMVVILVS